MSRKRQGGRTDERDEGATAFTLPMYRDQALTITISQVAFVRGALLSFSRSRVSFNAKMPGGGVCGSGGLIRMDVETDNLYPLSALDYIVGVTILSDRPKPLCTAPSRRKATVSRDRFSLRVPGNKSR